MHTVKRFVVLSLSLFLVACAAGPKDPVTGLHKNLLTIDSHVDIPLDFATPDNDPGAPSSMQLDLPQMREGGMDAAFFVVYVPQDLRDARGYEAAHKAALHKFDAIRRMVSQYPDQIGLARSPDDVRRLHAEGKLVAMIGIENGYVIGNNPSLLDAYYQLGARYMSLTHAGHNDLADSATPIGALDKKSDAEHGGLSELGRNVVRRMNELGMMVDVSHASDTTALDIIALSEAPVIASHSAVAALHDVPRNITDGAIRAIAQRGGVVQVVAYDVYLKRPPDEKIEALRKLREELDLTDIMAIRAASKEQLHELVRRARELDAVWPRATVADLVDHIDHVVKLVGVDHVGIASDFGGGGGITGWMTTGETENVTRELVARGYSEADIAKIWGGNLLRVWQKVMETALSLRQGNDDLVRVPDGLPPRPAPAETPNDE